MSLNNYFNKVIFAATALLILLTIGTTANANESSLGNSKQIIASKITKKIDGHQYQILSSPNVKSTSVKLVGNSKGIKAINALLLKSYLSGIDDELSCVDTEKQGGTWELTFNDSVISWINNYVVIQTYSEGYCGGAHGFGGHNALTYNLTTGKVEVTGKWFNRSFIDEKYGYFKRIYREDMDAVDDEGMPKTTPITVLGNLLRDRYFTQQQKLVKTEEDKALLDECAEAVEFGGSFWPTKNGLSFSTYLPYVYRGCDDDVILPYHQAMPFLSKQGKQAIKAFKEKK
jgi:hypothetical protein